MKILQLLCFPLHGSGSGTYVKKLSEALMKRGDEVAVVAPETRKEQRIKLYPVELPYMVAFTGHPEHPDSKLYSEISGSELNRIQSIFSHAIVEAVEDFKPDVIHVHHASNLSWIAQYIKAVYQIHYVVTSHNTDVINAILDKRYIPLSQDALNRADIITAVSANTRERLLKTIGMGMKTLARKTKIVPCGVDTMTFPLRGSTNEVTEKYDLGDSKVFLYSGKITSIKGVDYFIKAAQKLQNEKFVIMGDGGEMDKMRSLVKELKLTNVIFTGYLGSEERHLVAEFYRRAHITVVPSTVSEGIPLSALESMSSGTPVIGSDIGGIPTAVKHGKNGWLVKPRNLKDLTYAMEMTLKEPEKVEKAGKKARQDAIKKFDWTVIAKQMEKYYEIPYQRSLKAKESKKPSYVSEEEFKSGKEFAKNKDKL